MKRILFVILFFLLSPWLWAQVEKAELKNRDNDSGYNSDSRLLLSQENRWVTFEMIGKCTIHRKDHLKIKKAKLVEIKPKYITFLSDGNLHDIMIDEISKISTSIPVKEVYSADNYYLLKFDEENQPYFSEND